MYLYICTKQLKNRKTNNMRTFKNYEAVKINSEEEAMEFLRYLEDNTDLKSPMGEKPTEISRRELNWCGFPIYFEVYENMLFIVRSSYLSTKTKIIPLSEFIKPKVTYTREQAEAVLKDYNLFHNYAFPLDRTDIAFLDHKFPKPILEQVTEAVKDLGDFSIEQTSTGAILISPIKITEK